MPRPFSDTIINTELGQYRNGRWSRLLANIWLKLHKLPLTEWPEDVIGATSAIRDDYLAAIRAADTGDFAPLIEMHRRFAAES